MFKPAWSIFFPLAVFHPEGLQYPLTSVFTHPEVRGPVEVHTSLEKVLVLKETNLHLRKLSIFKPTTNKKLFKK